MDKLRMDGEKYMAEPGVVKVTALTRIESIMTWRACPLCDSMERRVLVQLRASQFCSVNSTYRSDYARILDIEPEMSFPIVECVNCRFVYAGVLPPPAFIQRVYDEVIDGDKGFFESVRPEWFGHQLRMAGQLLAELSDILGTQANPSILDFGCGYGTLLKTLTGPRTRCVGFEPSPRRLASLRSENLPAYSTIEEIERMGPYDAVILNDVLEHIARPRENVALCRKLLSPRGILCVHVPDFGPRRMRQTLMLARRGDPFTPELNPWEHLNYFSSASLQRLIAAEGFCVMEPSTPVDLGVRPRLTGIGRVGNCLKSGLRLLLYAMGRKTTSTRVVAQKRN